MKRVRNDSPLVRAVFVVAALCFVGAAVYFFVRSFRLMGI